MKNSQQAQKLASLLIDYLRSTNQAALPPHLMRDLHEAANQEDASNAVIVTTAIPLDNQDKTAIKNFVVKRGGAGRKIIYSLNPSLIAGFTVKIGDELVDASVVSKLTHLKDHLGVLL